MKVTTEDKWECLFVAAWLYVLNRMRTPEHLQARHNVHTIPYEMAKLGYGRIHDLKIYAGRLDEKINKHTN